MYILHISISKKSIFYFIFSVTPISKKRNINTLVFADYFIILLFYFLLAFTGIFAFEEINDLYTLNFQPDPEEPWYMKVIHYFLSLFPVFTLSTNFPIIAITLRNNLQTLFLTEGKVQNLHWKLGRLTPSFGSILAVCHKKYFFCFPR